MIQKELPLLGLAVMSLAGCSGQSDAIQALRAKLQQDQSSGAVAYVVGDEIHVCEMPNCFPEQRIIKTKFQLEDTPYSLLWLNAREIVFAAFAPRPPEKLKEVQLELERLAAQAGASTQNSFARSCIVQILDIETGEKRTIVDPYAEDSPLKEVLGDISTKETDSLKQLVNIVKDHNAKSWYEKGSLNLSFFPVFSPTDIGYSASTQQLYYQIGNKWYSGAIDGSSFQLPTRIPSDIVHDQRLDPSGSLVLDQDMSSWQLRVYVTDPENSAKLYFEQPSSTPAWRPNKE